MKRTKRKKTKSGDSMFLPFMSQNEINFKLWNKKKPELI
jgi:hypothetical protein